MVSNANLVLPNTMVNGVVGQSNDVNDFHESWGQKKVAVQANELGALNFFLFLKRVKDFKAELKKQ